jgi:hypothetical protein
MPSLTKATVDPLHQPTARPEGMRGLFQVAVVSLCLLSFLTTVMCILMTQLSGEMAGNRDFIVYWATGQQLLHHGNPYDPHAMSSIERGAGMPAKYSVNYMRNPPWALPLALPLGMLGFRAASLVGAAGLALCFVVSVQLLWQMYGRPQSSLYFIGYSFAPALVCLIWGQTSLFALLGLVLFLRLYRTQPFAAGMALWFCLLKPHLLLPFFAVLFAWILASGSYRVLAGAVVALAVSCALAYAIDPMAFGQYLHMASTSGVEHQDIPSISVLLRNWIAPQAFWVQFVPAALGSLWALKYFWNRRKEWEWRQHGSLVALASILVTPYAYLGDQVIALPSLMYGASRTRSMNIMAVIAFASALIEIAFFSSGPFPAGLKIASLLAVPVWLAWYLFVTRSATASLSATE